MARLKVELDESSSSLKETLEAMGDLEEESRWVKDDLDDVRAWNANLETKLLTSEQGCTKAIKAREEVTTKHKALEEELSHYQSFLLCVGKEGFNQGIHQATYFHGIPVDKD